MFTTAYYTILDVFKCNTHFTSVQCNLCPHMCILKLNDVGKCLTRKNSNNTLVTDNYYKAVSVSIDHIEKKPFRHFFPNSLILSTGPNGCNFKCSFCQNHEISQVITATQSITSEQLINAAIQNNTIGIAYTFTEPTIWFETIMNVGSIVKEKNLKNVIVSNGFINPDPLNDLLTIIDAWNIDIKSMNSDFYSEICGAPITTLQYVLNTCATIKSSGKHLEITNLLIPGKNDSDSDIEHLVQYISYLDKDIPIHFAKYFPCHNMNPHIPQTSDERLKSAVEIAKTKLNNVYIK